MEQEQRTENYFKKHWNGNFSPLWSFFVNLVGVYILSSIAVASLGVSGFLPVGVGIGMFLIVQLWAIIGTSRALIRSIRAEDTSSGPKAISLVLLALLAAFVVLLILDVSRLIG